MLTLLSAGLTNTIINLVKAPETSTEIFTIPSNIIIAVKIVIAVILFLIFFYRTVKPNEIGIRVFLGLPGKEVGSGPKLIFWPFYKIVKFPTTRQAIKFAVPTTVTKKGKIANKSNTKKSEEDKNDICASDVVEETEINILFTIFYYFKKGNLAKTLEKAPGITEKKLSEELVPFCIDILGVLIGRLPWRLINEERYKFGQVALARMGATTGKKFKIEKHKIEDDKSTLAYRFAEDNKGLSDKDLEASPFVQFGLDNISLALENIDFVDEELRKAVSGPEKARLDAKSLVIKADANAYETKKKGKAEAYAKNEMLKAIEKHPESELLSGMKDFANGSDKIIFPMPDVVQKTISTLMKKVDKNN